MAYRLGVDIGGTFTDAIICDEDTGQIFVDKVPSTPKDPSVGFLQITERILSKNEITPGEINFVVHGTTVATNAIIEGTMARTAFITTDGFRDMLEIGRQSRPALYDFGFEKLKPLVSRDLCFGIPERLDAQGKVITPLDEAAVREVAGQLQEIGIESIAVCLLHAHINPVHEKAIGQILTAVLPEANLSLSSEIAPEFREYFRASTTIINAGIRPIVSRYLQNIEDRLRGEGVKGDFLVMQSNGGVQTFGAASERPVFMVESGPAAGVVAATYLGSAIGYKDVISFDMGGTTAKVGLTLDGRPNVTKDYEVGAAAGAGTGSARGSGYPIRTPVIDLVEIGAGGGSIAWVDSGGALRVGPQSAGADPGPACYGWGGEEPTVTDANLVLGRLNAEFFLGGEIELDLEKSSRAIRNCADQLGMNVVETAYGIVEIANAAMVKALRLVSIQRGYDPREFVLVAFGGAGPVHSGRLAMELSIPTTVVPLSPGTFSALGLLATDLKHDFSQTLIRQVDGLDPSVVEDVFRSLEDRGRLLLSREGAGLDDMVVLRQIEMRYVGQSYELTLELPSQMLTDADLKRLMNEFSGVHEREYGFSVPGEPVEIVNLRLSALGTISKPRFRELDPQLGSLVETQRGIRSVYFAEAGGFVDCPVYDRYQFGYGAMMVGPAVVEEPDSTTIVHPGCRAEVDKFGNLILSGSG